MTVFVASGGCVEASLQGEEGKGKVGRTEKEGEGKVKNGKGRMEKERKWEERNGK